MVTVFEDRRGETYPELPWEPKAAFATLAEAYGLTAPYGRGIMRWWRPA